MPWWPPSYRRAKNCENLCVCPLKKLMVHMQNVLKKNEFCCKFCCICHLGRLPAKIIDVHPSKIPASVCSLAGRFMTYLVANPWRQFSHDMAQTNLPYLLSARYLSLSTSTCTSQSKITPVNRRKQKIPVSKNLQIWLSAPSNMQFFHKFML